MPTRTKRRAISSTYEAQLLLADDVAERLRCSRRHVLRMAKRGLMPPPVRLGSLVRWPRASIETWIEAGCHRPQSLG
jgi:excisionase family DNA binding protein